MRNVGDLLVAEGRLLPGRWGGILCRRDGLVEAGLMGQEASCDAHVPPHRLLRLGPPCLVWLWGEEQVCGRGS